MSKMRVLLVADGRSPITRSWIAMLQFNGCHVCLASTFPYHPIDGLESQTTIPVGFSSFAGGQVNGQGGRKASWRKRLVGLARPLLMRLRAAAAPHLLQPAREQLNAYTASCRPDLVHALRIPFEGMLCASIPEEVPLAISIWGNDLTLHAKSSTGMNRLTGSVLARADALLADASRDITLAKQSGLREGIPSLVVPGSGGLDLHAMAQSWKKTGVVLRKFKIPAGRPLVINPRGFRPGSVHQDVFFKNIPLVLEKMPDTYFVCPGMLGQPLAEKWVQTMGISRSVALLPFLPQDELWALYASAAVYLSLSSHDGTPNSFLEAIASGCYPIVGDIASLREWITPGENGTLVDPLDARSAAEAVCGVIGNENLRGYAARKNNDIIKQRADREVVSRQVAALYQRLA